MKVDLGSTRRSVKVYDPTVGATLIAGLDKVKALPLTLNDHPEIIEIPAAG